MKNTYLYYNNHLVDDKDIEEFEKFRCSDGRLRFIYKTIIVETNEYYIGQHTTDRYKGNTVIDGYIGSGQAIRSYISKYGKVGIETHILQFANSSIELSKLEESFVNKDILKDELNLNKRVGGQIAALEGKPSIVYDYNGKQYTIDELSKIAGCNSATMLYRIKIKRTIKDAVESKYHEHTVYKIGDDGISLTEYGNRIGISESTLRGRIKNGHSLVEALSMPLRQFSKKITYKGITDTMRGWEKRIGIERHFIRKMLERKYTIEEVFSHYEKMKNMDAKEKLRYTRKYLKTKH